MSRVWKSTKISNSFMNGSTYLSFRKRDIWYIALGEIVRTKIKSNISIYEFSITLEKLVIILYFILASCLFIDSQKGLNERPISQGKSKLRGFVELLLCVEINGQGWFCPAIESNTIDRIAMLMSSMIDTIACVLHVPIITLVFGDFSYLISTTLIFSICITRVHWNQLRSFAYIIRWLRDFE